MTEREKVIKGLECCAVGAECDHCPYSNLNIGGFAGCYQMHQDALALLKAQEPRVMTLEEVVGNIVLGRDVMLWFEFNDSIKELNAKDIEYNDYLCDDDMPTLYEPNLKWRDNGYRDGVIVAEYNDVFRCWTSRPTEEQREAVKWDAVD